MKLLVLGHLSFDILHTPDGNEREEGGGLFRVLSALSAEGGKLDRFTPVAGAGRKELPLLRERLGAIPGVETDGLFTSEVPMHRVHYYVRNTEDVVECTKELAPPIPFSRIRPHLDVNGILVNMISGVDITLDTLDEIRMAVRNDGIPIHLDMHSLTLGVNDRHERFRRPLPEWRRWAFMIDTVQMNEEEVLALGEAMKPEEHTIGHMLTLGVKGVIITRGARGASLFVNEHKQMVRTDIPGEANGNSVSPIGRGDIFGAAFFHHYLKNHALLAAAQHAVAVAAAPGTP
jgi:hypothetical protein